MIPIPPSAKWWKTYPSLAPKREIERNHAAIVQHLQNGFRRRPDVDDAVPETMLVQGGERLDLIVHHKDESKTAVEVKSGYEP